MSEQFSEELLRHLPKLRAYARCLAKSDLQADQLIHETLTKAWRSQGAVGVGADLRAALFKLLRNSFHERQGWGSSGERVAARNGASDPWRRDHREVLGALERLRPDAREALLLVTGAGLSFPEAAEVCGCPAGTMKARVARARATMATLAAGDAPGEPASALSACA